MDVAGGRPQHLLSSRDGRLLLAAHAGWALTSGSLLFSIPWTALERGAGPRVATWLVALILAGYFCVAAQAGRRADSGSRRALVRYATALCLGVTATCAGWQSLADVPLIVFGVALFLLGVAGGMLLAGSYAAADVLVAPEGLRGAHAQLVTLDQLAGFGFGALSALLLEVLSFGQLLVLQTGVAGMATLAAVAISHPLHGAAHGTGVKPVTFRRLFRRPGRVRFLLLLGGVWNVFIPAFLALQLSWLHTGLRLDSGQAALVLAAGAFGTLLASVLLSHRRLTISSARLLACALTAQVVLLTLTALVPRGSVVMAAGAVAAMMLVNSSALSLVTTARTEASPPHERGAVVATGQIVHRAAYLASATAWGALVPVIGFSLVFGAAAAGVTLVAAALWLHLASAHNVEHAPAAPSAEDATVAGAA